MTTRERNLNKFKADIIRLLNSTNKFKESLLEVHKLANNIFKGYQPWRPKTDSCNKLEDTFLNMKLGLNK